MEKQKPWQFYLILAVIVLTLYNILPTVFFYSKPLRAPIDAPRAEEVAKGIVDRVNSLESTSIEWLQSFAKLVRVSPTSIALNSTDPRLIDVSFKTAQDAALFKRFLPQAGAMIPFVPSQLQLGSSLTGDGQHRVTVERQIGVHLSPQEVSSLFQFSDLFDASGLPTTLYRDLVFDRAERIALAFTGPSPSGEDVQALFAGGSGANNDELTLSLARHIVDAQKVLASKHAKIFDRVLASLTQVSGAKPENTASVLSLALKATQSRLTTQKQGLLGGKVAAADSETRARVAQVDQQLRTVEQAIAIVDKNAKSVNAGATPMTSTNVQKALQDSLVKYDAEAKIQTVDLNGQHPFVKDLRIDWGNGQILLGLYDDVQAVRDAEPKSEEDAYVQDKLNQMLIQEVARVSQIADESITPKGELFGVTLNTLTDTRSLLAFDLGTVAKKQTDQISALLHSNWKPAHPDLTHDSYPLVSYEKFRALPPQDQKLGLIVYAPSMSTDVPPEGFSPDSIYVIARGLDDIIRKYKDVPTAEGAEEFIKDFNSLNDMLRQAGFIAYAGSSRGIAPEYSKDFIFRLPHYYGNLIMATREDFQVKGSKRFAVLDFTDVEQRILTVNKIDDRIQEDLLKWRDEYHAAQVDLNTANRYTVPAPTQNPFLQNVKLSAVKYFRGDDRKILKWGLDLSGGKTVRIGLRDRNGHPVTNRDDLNQAVNELYTRINKMGVAERTIRIENENIILDFPGSQALSAQELVKASAMYFHIANEKFGPMNRELAPIVNEFLQEVWNEAVVTNRKDAESINDIAWRHLGGENDEAGLVQPRSESARILYDNGLRFASPNDRSVSSSFNDTLSKVAVLRGADISEWQGQANPLLVVFHNYALEGSSLEGIQVGYDPSEGNILMFGVKSSYEGGADRGSGSPRDDFYTWTSQFAEEKIVGTAKEGYSQGRGWRMAVILDDTVVTSPSLKAALRDRASITGRFSQREINQLASDLKAGSLSFTPRVLSEQNISPELGKEERHSAIIAAAAAALSIIVVMVSYYHFGGIVASIAVFFNLLIMWGVFQNIGAALTLPSIAGIVLTMAMAVDANVLVFERIREEFALTGRIASAIQAGYRKAFSAIVDSNITTIIAALILIQFDAGPIKGFAIALIIGIVASMFTALFMTRYYFAGWVQNPSHTKLTMAQLFKRTNFDFLAQTKKAVIVTIVVLALGIVALVSQRHTILGMDFTGGYSISLNLAEKPGVTNYRHLALEALETAGVAAHDVQIQQLSRPNQLRIQLGTGMEEAGRPFHGMSERLTEGVFEYSYQSNPRLNWVVNALETAGLHPQQADLARLESNWTVMSGQFSDVMRNQAIMALGLAFLAVLVYITFRFEFKFGMAAVVGLLHDVLLTVGILAIFRWLGMSVQIDLPVIGAIMTIVGYSLNDTIIVFDRIREDIRLLRKLSWEEIINHALNVTLARTVMTSGTTILVLLCLTVLGGSSIFAFSLVMTIGVVVGTLSSLFIAAPALLFFHNREVKAEEEQLRVQHSR